MADLTLAELAKMLVAQDERLTQMQERITVLEEEMRTYTRPVCTHSVPNDL